MSQICRVQRVSHLNVLPLCWRRFASQAFGNRCVQFSSAPVTWYGFLLGPDGAKSSDGVPTQNSPTASGTIRGATITSSFFGGGTCELLYSLLQLQVIILRKAN